MTELIKYVRANFIISTAVEKFGFFGNGVDDCDSNYAPAILLAVGMEHGYDPAEIAAAAHIAESRIADLMNIDARHELHKSERYLTKKGLIYNAIRLATFAEKLERREALCAIR